MSDKPLLFITRKLPEKIVRHYRDQFEIEMWEKEEEPVPRNLLLEKSEQANGLLTMLTDQIDDEILSRPSLKIISNLAVGYDNIDITSAKKHGVTVTNTPDVLTDTTADLTFGLLMAAARRILEANEAIRDNEWGPWSPLFMAGADIHHKTIGIVGMGRIGEAVAQRAKGFDMNILYYNRSRKPEAEERLGAVYSSFDHVIEQSDYIVCMTPLTPETNQMFHKEVFQHMKKEAIFINTSRGKTVNEKDLYEALMNKEIAGAGLDVFENEPIDSDHPLLSLKQVVCLPHIGSASIETRYQMMDLCLENMDLFFNGEKPKTPIQ